MADASKLKRRSSLGEPPARSEPTSNLSAPEVVPVVPPVAVQPAAAAVAPRAVAPAAAPTGERIDGRALRKTGRTVMFGTRVTPEFEAKLKSIAARDGLKIVEVLERALAAYEAAQ